MNEKIIVEETILEKKIFLFFIFVSAGFFFPNRGWIVNEKTIVEETILEKKIFLFFIFVSAGFFFSRSRMDCERENHL